MPSAFVVLLLLGSAVGADSGEAETPRLTKLTNIETSYPFWSPDGGRIVFQSNRNDDNSDIYVFNSDGTGIVRLTHDPATDQTRGGSDAVNLTKHPAYDGSSSST